MFVGFSLATVETIWYTIIKEDVESVTQHLACGVDATSKALVNMTSLHRAAWNAHKDVVEPLIANGVEVNPKNEHGHRPLDAANATIHPKPADLLRKHRAKTAEEFKAEGK
jgi:hypothetical protein